MAVFYTTRRTIGGVEFPMYAISTAWATAHSGPFRFTGAGDTINDTHFGTLWLVSDNLLTLYAVPTAMPGYVDVTGQPPNTGMAGSASPRACLASCHKAHDFDLSVNRDWFEGAHRPAVQGPVAGTALTLVGPAGSAGWKAVDNGGYRAACMRCHNSMGFAEASASQGQAASAFGFRTPVQTPAGRSDGFITCNACHDGTAYPVAADPRLRFADSVYLYSHNGRASSSILVTGAAGSAVCIYCHQGSEDAAGVAAALAAHSASPGGSPLAAIAAHGQPAAAMLYGAKGCEFPSKRYVGPQTAHASAGCTGC